MEIGKGGEGGQNLFSCSWYTHMLATLERDLVMFGIQASVHPLRLALERELRAHTHTCLESQIQKTAHP